MPVRLSLQLHPQSRCDPLAGIAVELARTSPLTLQVRYVLIGPPRNIRLRPRPEDEGDALWQHTCFEAFVRAEGEEGYVEFNVAPSARWAAYRFAGYREGKEDAAGAAVSLLSVEQRNRPLDPERRRRAEESGLDTSQEYEPCFYSLKAEMKLDPAMAMALDRPWRLGLSTVVEERNGRISYWALAHPPGEPDFHHPDCFALELPAARPA
jgi:hypothetical protein